MTGQEKGRKDKGKVKGRAKKESNRKCRPPGLLTGVEYDDNALC